jgi:GT2 family glycosyltransferase
MTARGHTTVVIATRNRKDCIHATLRRLTPQSFKIAVVDNASEDGTAAMIGKEFPSVHVIRMPVNEGAFARTIGAKQSSTPYIAFCDDDTWWLPGSIERGEEIFDAYPRVGLLNACVTVNGEERCDPACELMAHGLRDDGIPGAPIACFLAGSCMVRREAFLHSGGYERRFVIGAEETLLAIDLQRNGWLMRYVPSMTVRHDPCPMERNPALRRRFVFRNRLWTAWMRLAPADAWRVTADAMLRALRDRTLRRALIDAVRGLPWAIARRRGIDTVLSAQVRAMLSVDP